MKIKKLSRLNFQNFGVRNFLSGSVYEINIQTVLANWGDENRMSG
jgi:hypothetical protein